MSNKPLVPQAKDALDKMKTEYANEIGTKLNDAYKGNLPSAYFTRIRTPIPVTSGQCNGIIRTALQKHPDTLSS